MKKAIWLVVVFLSFCLPGHCQNTNNNGDDTYYPQPSDNYDDDNTDNTNVDNGDNSGVTYQTFYDQLSPYGSWVNYPDQGYVWVPNQGADFSPYVTGGHWVYSDIGWTWVSDYDWGWGPFHYGRWFMDDSYGWMWQPGYEWAPAWVEWGNYDNYYCWAPIGPRGYISTHYRPEGRYWNFVDRAHITDVNIRDRAYANRDIIQRVPDVANHISVYSHANTYHQSVYFAGPKAEEVEKATGQKITTMHITTNDRAGATRVSGNQVNIYRPAVHIATKQITPTKVTRTEDLKPGNRPGNAPVQQQQQPAQQRNTPQQQQVHSAPEQQRPQPTTPPRQSTPLPQRAPNETPAEKPHGRYFEPNPIQQQQSRPVQSAPQRSYSPPAAPSRSFSAPAPSGGGRGGGGGRR